MAQQLRQQQRTKRCHWVPQAYLRAFAADAPARQKIWRFSKNHGAPDPQLKPIKKVAMRLHLYAPLDTKSGARDDSFERRLSDLERWFGDPVWRSLCDDFVDLSWEPLRKMVALLAAVMQFRNPSHLEMHKQIHGRLVGAINSMPKLPAGYEYEGQFYPFDPAHWPSYRDASENDLKRNWLNDVGSCAWYAELLVGMRWSILVADQPVFITSDNPMTVVHPSLEFRGVGNPETAILFPLSPTRLLYMDHRHQEPANQYYPLKDDGASTNLLLWRGSNEHMFSHRHTDEVCAAILADAERQGFA